MPPRSDADYCRCDVLYSHVIIFMNGYCSEWKEIWKITQVWIRFYWNILSITCALLALWLQLSLSHTRLQVWMILLIAKLREDNVFSHGCLSVMLYVVLSTIGQLAFDWNAFLLQIFLQLISANSINVIQGKNEIYWLYIEITLFKRVFRI